MQGLPADAVQKLSPCDVERLQKCLAENKGDRDKCLEEINAFQRACGKVSKGSGAEQPPPAATFARQ